MPAVPATQFPRQGGREMTARNTVPRVIFPRAVYALPEFRRRTGLGEAAMRTARRCGLEVLEIGGRRFVRGIAWVRYCNAVAAGEIDPKGGGK